MIGSSTEEVDRRRIYAFVINEVLWRDKGRRWHWSGIRINSMTRVARLLDDDPRYRIACSQTNSSTCNRLNSVTTRLNRKGDAQGPAASLHPDDPDVTLAALGPCFALTERKKAITWQHHVTRKNWVSSSSA